MALITCAECGNSLSSLAKACPSCGAPPPVPNIWEDDQPLLPAKAAGVTAKSSGDRRIGLPLGLGILFLPFIFAWFTLRDGYSGAARLVAFGWLALVVAPVVMSDDFRLARPASETAQPPRSAGPGSATSSTFAKGADPMERCW